MSTLSKTRNSFERLVHQKGATVHWHRELGGVSCPCLTPEGFRDPEWHIAHPAGDSFYADIPNDLRAQIENAQANYVQPRGVDIALFFAFIANGWNTLYATTTGGRIFDFITALNLLVANGVTTALTDWGLLGSSPDTNGNRQWFFCTLPGVALDNYPNMAASTHMAATGTWTMQSIGITPTPDLINPVCNDDGKIYPSIQDRNVKGFVQPAFISTRSRSNQLLMQAFGEIQADDHIGIFPMDYDGFALDFADWSNSGTDWLEFNGMRFIAVAWNLLPAPDNANVNHHWEVALRRVNKDEPNG